MYIFPVPHCSVSVRVKYIHRNPFDFTEVSYSLGSLDFIRELCLIDLKRLQRTRLGEIGAQMHWGKMM